MSVKQGNLYHITTTASQQNLIMPNVKIKGVVLTNASVAAAITLTISDYHASAPKTVMILKISSTELCKHFDFSAQPLILTNGLAVPASGLTTGATATFIYEGQGA